MLPLIMLTGTGVAQVYHLFRLLVEPTVRWMPNASHHRARERHWQKDKKLASRAPVHVVDTY